MRSRLLHTHAPLVHSARPVLFERFGRDIGDFGNVEFRSIGRELGHAVEEATDISTTARYLSSPAIPYADSPALGVRIVTQ